MRLASERWPEDFIEIRLDTTGARPQVVARVERVKEEPRDRPIAGHRAHVTRTSRLLAEALCVERELGSGTSGTAMTRLSDGADAQTRALALFLASSRRHSELVIRPFRRVSRSPTCRCLRA